MILRRLRDCWRRRSQSDEGAVLVLVAASMIVLIGSTAMSVDLGRLVADRRTLQSEADLVSLDASWYLNGLPANQVWNSVCAAAMASAARNKTTLNCNSQVMLGQYTPPGGSFTPLSNADPVNAPNAVQITMSDTLPFLFVPPDVTPGVTTSRSAAAGIPSTPGGPGVNGTSTLGFTIGSFLVGWNTNNPVAGAVLDTLLHTSSTGRLVGYQGLVNSFFTLGDLATASAGALTVDHVFTGAVTLQQIIGAEIKLLTNAGNSAAAADLQAIQLGMGTYGSTAIGSPILSLGTSMGYGSVAAAESAVPVNGADFILVAAEVASGSSGLNLNAVAAGLSAQVTMIQPPVVVPAEPPNTASGTTAQLSAVLSLSGGSTTFTGAQATGELTAINCGTLASTIGVTTTGLTATSPPPQPAQTFAPGRGNANFVPPYSPPQTQTVASTNPTLTTVPVVGTLGPVLNQVLSDLGFTVAGVDITPTANNGPSCPAVGSQSTLGIPLLIQ